MDISTLKEQIKTGKFDPFYIFYGEEWQVMRVYIDKIVEKGGYEKSCPESIVEVYQNMRHSALIPVKHLYYIIDDKEFLTNEKAWDAVGDGRDFKDDVVIFYYTTHDKRLKFWKRYENRAIEFAKLENRVLAKHIKKEIDLSDANCEELINVCEGDYGRILLEIDKIRKYGESANKSFLELLYNGVIYRPPKDTIFDFVGAVLDRDINRAWNLLMQSYEVGESTMALLSVLYNNARTLLQVQASKDTKDLGLNGFVIKNVLPYKDRYTNGELVRMMRKIRECEVGIKTGKIPESITVEKVLVETI